MEDLNFEYSRGIGEKILRTTFLTLAALAIVIGTSDARKLYIIYSEGQRMDFTKFGQNLQESLGIIRLSEHEDEQELGET